MNLGLAFRPRRGREKVYVIMKMSWNFLDISLKVLVHVDFSRELKIFVCMCNTSLQKKRARSGETYILRYVRGRRGEMPLRIKYKARKDRQAEGREKISGSVDLGQALMKSRDLQLQPRFSHSTSAQSKCLKCKMETYLRQFLNIHGFIPPNEQDLYGLNCVPPPFLF